MCHNSMKTSYETENKAFLRLREMDGHGEITLEQATIADVNTW